MFVLFVFTPILYKFNCCFGNSLISWFKFSFVIDFSNEYNSYKELFGKRSNTNTKDYFSSRINLINKLYNYTQKNTDSKDEFRDKIYAKTGTAGESTCRICNDSKIDRRTFQAAHIISKFNGGCPELNNLFPTCSKCNNIMQTTDLDTYCTVHKIKLSL